MSLSGASGAIPRNDNRRMDAHAERYYDMALSWQRLIDGKNIKEMDIILLKHELAEIEFMLQGYTFEEAHELAEKEYNYASYVKELNAREEIF